MQKNAFWAKKLKKMGSLGFSGTHLNFSECYFVIPRTLKLTKLSPIWTHKMLEQKGGNFIEKIFAL